jgi:MFS family permease
MFRAVAALSSLLLAAAILFAGNGLQGTLLAVRGKLEAFPVGLIGLLMSAYFGGFILGCRFNPLFIKSVGHIRTFVALASIASAATLVHPLYVDVFAWAALRAVSGFCFAGLVMILESWINERAQNANRGRVLSVYRIVDLGATLVGNALLATADPEGFQLFALVSILVSIALAPVALTRIEAPRPINTARLDIRKLYRVSPAAAVGAPLVGLANAAFWAVGPVFAQASGFDQEGIALFMSAVIVGAAVFQWPLGWLSDRIDRRYVMLGGALLCVAASLALAEFGPTSAEALAALGFFVGAFMIPMFGLTAAHANDHAAPEEAVATNGGLLLLHGCGSVVGATLGASVMSAFGPPALFQYIAVVYFIFGTVCLYRIARRPAPVAGKTPFAPVPRTASPVVFEMGEIEPAVPEKTD